ncbi:MAG: hypothetical protein C0408_02280 [Odoribacter sp.]|nr:hypothetical protein [Odoribacter sp.]
MFSIYILSRRYNNCFSQMKKFFLLSMLSIIISINSCKKDNMPVSSFSMDKTTGKVGETITFTNLSKNANSFVWYFGDGISSTTKNPTHSYLSAWTFTITLYAYNDEGVSKSTKTILISP